MPPKQTQPAKTYSESFKRKVATEAFMKTPTGGYPAVAKKHKLKPGEVFDWVEQYFPSEEPAPFSSLHVWIGTTRKTQAGFARYFEHSPDYWEKWEQLEPGDKDVTGCGFCIDLGSQYLYDGDLFLYFHADRTRPVAEIVSELALSTDAAKTAILHACATNGTKTANVVFSYADPGQIVAEPDKRYNGIAYLGLFADED